jgi:adenylate kinase
MTLIMLGPPGAGKGTQTAVLSKKLGIISISTGHILRTAISERRPVGLEAKKYMDKGLLVPDDTIIEIVKDFFATNDIGKGCILDGVPRNIYQAEMLEKLGIQIDVAISLEISDAEIEERMSGRRACPKCGAGYHTKAIPPKKEGICDNCGEKLVTREDDRPETVRRRLEVYHKETEPIIAFYTKKGKLLSVDGTASIEETSEKVVKALEMIQ